jgi:hypothetical protein
MFDPNGFARRRAVSDVLASVPVVFQPPQQAVASGVPLYPPPETRNASGNQAASPPAE